MRALLTTCTAEKSTAPGVIPAAERYQGWRVVMARAQAQAQGVPLLFLSGVYGVIPASHPTPRYDHALQEDEVDGMIAATARQLTALEVETLTALLLPATTPGWAPYHRLLAAACQRAGVTCQVVLLAPR